MLVLIFLICCRPRPAEKEFDWIELSVTASAYNSVSWQTSGQPNLAAWGDTLKPGMRCIAVSRDLISKGLRHNTMVKIEGLEGVYLVKDKMHRRWINRIDIYMGKDVKRAREWGKQKLKIQYAVKRDSL
ncbi:3D domain-containing protein [Poritiphilus flavus]|uniref:3D (Asp-Asp-Asp) domain-containing protein n=1 Tax=Poritiphilus flavus TaxID=2697053 RepID=A0A6L9EG20_9FLAO|nr:3D domain-containing protein [Poritiphilus flavus]NAS13209.1 hypothetical protein [Poritiphilus flavus]